MTTGIGTQGNAVIDTTTGAISLGQGLVGGSSLFTITLPRATSKTEDKTIKIKYICKEEEPTAKLTLKDVSGGTWADMPTAHGTDGCNWYLNLNTTEKATLELKEKWYNNGTLVIAFQSNDYENTGCKYYIKIISVVIE